MKVLVFGLGALGTVYSCLLKNQGHQVYGVDIEAVSTAIQKTGVKVHGIWGEHEAALDKVVSDIHLLSEETFDLAIVTVKAFDTIAAVQEIKKILHGKTLVMLAQNGYGNYEAASTIIPREQIIVARVIFGSETEGPGLAKVTVIADDVVIGSPEGLIDMPCLENLAEICSSAGIPTRASREIMQYVWGKVIYNSALNPLGAILEVNYGKLAEMAPTRQLMDDMIEEVFAVLSAMQQTVLWKDASEYKEAFYGQMVPTTAGHHASMLQDIQRGRRTEIDSLNGAIVELGRRLGVPTPVHAVIAALLRAKETMFLRQD
ncbi:ketopantoate reductase family protein [Syntrophomonas palmitatica]|uniref:ketopantoate reductase family protein n=1 Tax=Syntrophomonas palmitatica TaxID=402877 RepID=UPI0006CF3555|nr:2-dehydropantoate 2-reductase [Syntrophomonas palmitatica]